MRLGRFLSALGRMRIGLGEFEEAETNLTEAHDILREAKGASARDRTDVLTCLAQLYEAWGKPQKAEEYRHILAEITAK